MSLIRTLTHRVLQPTVVTPVTGRPFYVSMQECEGMRRSTKAAIARNKNLAFPKCCQFFIRPSNQNIKCQGWQVRIKNRKSFSLNFWYTNIWPCLHFGWKSSDYIHIWDTLIIKLFYDTPVIIHCINWLPNASKQKINFMGWNVNFHWRAFTANLLSTTLKIKPVCTK